MASPAEDPAAGGRPSVEERAQGVLEQAQELAASVQSWVDFSNALFHPIKGIVAQAFPTLRERREFTMTKPYAAIYEILFSLMAKYGSADGDRPQASAAELAEAGRQRGWREIMNAQRQARDGKNERAS